MDKVIAMVRVAPFLTHGVYSSLRDPLSRAISRGKHDLNSLTSKLVLFFSKQLKGDGMNDVRNGLV